MVERSLIRFTLMACLFAICSTSYAIPPPETLLLVGGGILSPLLLLAGMLTVLAKYIWIKAKLAVFWRRYLPGILLFIALFSILINPLFYQPFALKNRPIDIQTAISWQQTALKPVIIDVREKKYYDKIHLLGAINLPQGRGLNAFLENPDFQKIILYCGVGLTSGDNMRWLYADNQLLKQALKENRLFYFPQGINQLINKREKNAFPLIINLNPAHAHYLLHMPNYVILNVQRNQNFAAQYQELLTNHKIPIINTQQHQDQLASKLSQLKLEQILFTDLSMANQPDYYNPIFILILSLILILAFLLRRREFFRALLLRASPAYQYAGLVISLFAAIAYAPFATHFPLPFDLYLFSLYVKIPMDLRYFIATFLLLGLALFLQLAYPGKKRLELLRQQIGRNFTDAKYLPRIFKPHRLKNSLIVFSVLIAIYIIQPPLTSLFILAVFLMSQLLFDVLLYLWYRQKPILHLLGKCGYDCDPQGETAIRLDSDDASSLAAIKVTREQFSCHLGLFSGDFIAKTREITLEKNERLFYCQLMRDLFLFFQQDLSVSITKARKIIAINLTGNSFSAKAINRHILLEHYYLLPHSLTEKRFSSTLFAEVFTNPTPLSLDVLQTNWKKGGGYLKALKKLFFLIKVNPQAEKQFLVLAHRIYLDKAFEQIIYAANQFHQLIRKKLMAISCQLALDNLVEDYYTLILPKAQLRLKSLDDNLAQPLTLKKLQAVLNQALVKLCTESAQWQYYCSLLHEYAYNQLLKAQEFTLIRNYSPQLPSYYDFTLPKDLSPSVESRSGNYSAFLMTEKFRTQMRELQLKEWQLIGLLLEKLRLALKLPVSLAYLTLEELTHLSPDTTALLDRLNYRYQYWQLQNQWVFPATFSLQDLEQQQTCQQEDKHFNAIRVAGNQTQIIGRAVLFNPKMSLGNLPRNSILIAKNLTAEQVIHCQHLRAIVLAQGSYLSHTSIIAREKNIPLIAQAAIGKIKPKQRLIISGNKIEPLSDNNLAWDFLEDLGDYSAAGHKAQRLALLQQHGFNVPEAIVLRQSSIEQIYHASRQDNSSLQSLEQLLKLFSPDKLPLIVRSSTNIEDSHDFSYAGLFYSEKGINDAAALLKSILTAWQQLENSVALVSQYSGFNKPLELNLIIQQYIVGQYGGVLFTQSNIEGLMQVEISQSGIEDVVQGKNPLTTLSIDEQGQSLNAIGDKHVLSAKQYQSLYQLGQKIAALFGCPQDIEWIMVDSQFYIIQSRDITFQL